MKDFELQPHIASNEKNIEKNINVQGVNQEVLSDIKDYLFDQYMKQQLVEDFFEEMSEYVDEGDVDAIKGALAEYTDQEVYSALSLPKELREKQFAAMQSSIQGGADPKEVLKNFVTISTRHGFAIGYHTSAAEITPNENKNNQWLIIGTERDHRDGDLARAYYSSHYRHLYSPKDHQLYVKKRAPQFIYVVRTDPTHKTDGNWSRASTLSVIMRVPYRDVVNYVENTARKLEETDTSEVSVPE